MARQAIFSGQLTADTMDGTEPYRVRFSYGVFSIAARVTQSGRYWYTHKRADGKLYKTYVGKQGEVTHDTLHRATMALMDKIRAETGKMYARNYRARNVTHKQGARDG